MLYFKLRKCYNDAHGNVILCVLCINIHIFNISVFEVSNVLRIDKDVPCGRLF